MLQSQIWSCRLSHILSSFVLIQVPGFEWKDVSPDFRHPNDKGHKLMADLAIRLLQKVVLDMTHW